MVNAVTSSLSRSARGRATVHHATVLRGSDGDADPRLPGMGIAPPTLVTLELEDFIPRFLARAAVAADYRRLLVEDLPTRESDGAWRLHPPLHRLAHLALIEAGCATPGEPPVDPGRIASAGVVVRLLADGMEHRWVKRGGKVLGWVPHDEAARDDDEAYEPDPKRRAARRRDPSWRMMVLAGAGYDDGLEEVAAPAFLASPAVGAALGRTLIYGAIPTASSDTSAPLQQPPFDDAFLALAIPGWLRALPKTIPPTGGTLVLGNAGVAIPDGALTSSTLALRREIAWLFQGTALEGPPASGADPRPATVKALFTTLSALSIGYDDNANGVTDRVEPLTSFLDRARQAMIEHTADSLRLPDRWPTIADEGAIQREIVACFTARWQSMSPGVGRFEDREARYVVRVFVRVRGDCGCAERTRWSLPTAACAIAPWFEGPALAPVRIALPALSDLKKLKPNVAFAVPPDLRAMLDSIDVKGLSDGKKGSPFGEWGMICSFSLPILTLCAFICLSLIIGMLNIVLSWMMWVKICIPYPKKAP